MGISLTILTGLIWGGIGVVLEVATKRKINSWVFIAIASTLSSIGAWSFFVRWDVVSSGEIQKPFQTFIILSIAGLFGTLGMVCLKKSMNAGASAWTVGQSSLVIPFIAGCILFDKHIHISGILGVSFILLCLFLFYQHTNSESKDKKPWFKDAILAFLFLGIQQTASSIPSSWDGWTDSANLRVPILLTSGCIPLVFYVLIIKSKIQQGLWNLSVIYAILVLIGQGCLFAAMDLLRKTQQLSLTFPIALGTCILFITLWDIIKQKSVPSFLTISGILCGLLGIIFLSCH